MLSMKHMNVDIYQHLEIMSNRTARTSLLSSLRKILKNDCDNLYYLETFLFF